MTASALKTIAIITMLIDHLGAVFFPQYRIMRMVGRLAFPIFAYFIAEGYSHTHDVRKYAMRLGAFALISEVPFDLAFFGKFFYMGYQNVFFTLMFGLLAIWCFDRYRYSSPVLAVGGVFGIGVLSVMMNTDYAIFGIIMMLLFHMLRDRQYAALLSVALLNLLYGLLGAGILSGSFNIAGGIQALAGLSALLLLFYNGQRGRSIKYLFYGFYPGHLLVIGLLAHGYL